LTDCFRCGSEEHLSRDCDQRTRRQPATRRRLWPGGQPPEPKPSEQDKMPAYARLDLTRRPPEEIADYAAWGQAARQALAIQLGQPEPDGPYVVTEFRQKFGLPPRTESQLRAIAREQVAEARAARDYIPDHTRDISASSALPVLHADA
jgi:hypothetical protein